MDLSIIIINYKSSPLVIQCIRSIIDQTSALTYELIVVDNDSADGSEAIITTTFPQVEWIQMGYNSGFARANNKGISEARGDVVLLLNADTIVVNQSIDVAFGLFKKSTYTACGVQLLNEDGTPQISGNFVITGGLNNLLPLPVVGNLIKKIGTLLNTKVPNVKDSSQELEVDWINGAFLMVKKKAVHEAGLMDEDFFLYAEEAEWCGRLRQYGRLCIFGQCKVIHLQGGTSGDAFHSKGKGYQNLFDKRGRQIMVSNFLRIRKQFGLGWFLFQLLIYIIDIPFFLIDVFFKTIILKDRARINDFKGYLINLSWVLKLSPGIILNKPHFYKLL